MGIPLVVTIPTTLQLVLVGKYTLSGIVLLYSTNLYAILAFFSSFDILGISSPDIEVILSKNSVSVSKN
jgi:hypothetical protein